MEEDPNILKLRPNDNSGISLVTTPLDGSNFLSWSRSMKLALIAKTKLSFISKDAEIPEKDTKEFKQWIKVDSMVTSWILNSISRNIVESFMYINTSRELWTELESRYGQSNELKGQWDELACITPIPKCTCTAAKESAEIKNSDQLMQFLMGLNDTYDHVRSQILMMEPYPDVSKAFSMVLRVEKQKEANTEPQYTSQNVVMQVYKKLGLCLDSNFGPFPRWAKNTAMFGFSFYTFTSHRLQPFFSPQTPPCHRLQPFLPTNSDRTDHSLAPSSPASDPPRRSEKKFIDSTAPAPLSLASSHHAGVTMTKPQTPLESAAIGRSRQRCAAGCWNRFSSAT
ncbi:UNVERIFIED_CONTAM: hypothetical protein Sindi_1328200 [Sesamum indicum]